MSLAIKGRFARIQDSYFPAAAQLHAVKFRSCGSRYDAARTWRCDLEGRVAIAVVPDNLALGA